MEVNGKKYDLSQIYGEIFKKQLVENNTQYNTIFEYFDNLDGKTDEKLSLKNLQNIFMQIKDMDNENGIQDGKLSDNEINDFVKKHLSNLKITKDDFKGFIVKLLNQNEKNKLDAVTTKSYKAEAKEDKYNFRLGKRQNGIRTIGADSVATKIGETGDNNNSNLRSQFYSVFAQLQNSSASSNAGFNSFKQGHRGDCYFVQEINSINNTTNGKLILDKNITKSGKDSYLITLPGAVLLKNDLKRRGLESKCEITGVYKVTPEAVSKLKQQAGKAYSEGNFKVMLLEVAMESYREELARTNRNIGKKENLYTAEGAGRTNDKDNLWGGFAWDAAFILTGQKSEVYHANNQKYNNALKYKPGKYGFITREQMESRSKKEMLSATQAKGLSEVTSVTNTEAGLHSMLDRMEGKDSKYAMSAGFVMQVNGDDGVTKKNSGHALSVLKVTPTTVYVLNPWYKDEKGNPCIEPIPRKDFEKMATKFSVCEMDMKKIQKTQSEVRKEAMSEFRQNLTNVINNINNNHNANNSSHTNDLIHLFNKQRKNNSQTSR